MFIYQKYNQMLDIRKKLADNGEIFRYWGEVHETLSDYTLKVKRMDTIYDGCFPYIRSCPSDIFELLSTLTEYKGKSFVDAGCGLPIIPQIAYDLGFESAYGIEIDTELIQFVNDNIKHDVEMINANMLDCDYSQYDVIYTYVPMWGSDVMIQFIKKVRKQMKSGAIFIIKGLGLILFENEAKRLRLTEKQLRMKYYIKK